MANKFNTKIDNIILNCLCNSYASYLTTKEEYDLQTYEGASTIYGSYQLDAVIQILLNLADGIYNTYMVSANNLAQAVSANNLAQAVSANNLAQAVSANNLAQAVKSYPL